MDLDTASTVYLAQSLITLLYIVQTNFLKNAPLCRGRLKAVAREATYTNAATMTKRVHREKIDF